MGVALPADAHEHQCAVNAECRQREQSQSLSSPPPLPTSLGPPGFCCASFFFFKFAFFFFHFLFSHSSPLVLFFFFLTRPSPSASFLEFSRGSPTSCLTAVLPTGACRDGAFFCPQALVVKTMCFCPHRHSSVVTMCFCPQALVSS